MRISRLALCGPGRFRIRRHLPGSVFALCLFITPGFFPVAHADSDWLGGACVACDELRVKLRVVRNQQNVLDQGLAMLEQAGRELQSNEDMADGFAAAYGVLGGSSIVLGAGTLPCSLPVQWLRGLWGGSGFLGAWIQGEGATEVALSTIISFVGTGVFAEAVTYRKFWKEYWEGSEDISRLENDLNRTKARMRQTKRDLQREETSLLQWMREGDCEKEDESLEDLL